MPSFPFDKTDYETVAQDNQLESDCCDGLNPLSAGLTSSELCYILRWIVDFEMLNFYQNASIRQFAKKVHLTDPGNNSPTRMSKTNKRNQLYIFAVAHFGSPGI